MQMTNEEYLLVKLSEECAEVIQRINKAQRFGLNEVQISNPNENRNNRQRIGDELEDLLVIADLLQRLNSTYSPHPESKLVKIARVQKYSEYSRSLGILI